MSDPTRTGMSDPTRTGMSDPTRTGMSDPARTAIAGLPTRVRQRPKALAGVGVVALLLLGYPLAVERAVAWVGIRGAAAGLIAVALASAALLRGAPSPVPGGIGRLSRAAVVALLALALATGDPAPLRGVVAVVYFALAGLFWRSLRDGGSIIETLVRSLEPATPDFVRPYCRKTTALWSGFFAVNGLVLAVLAVRGPAETWALYSGRIVYLEMGVIFLVEFLVRKTWFRYYFGSGPFDRLWSSLFPAENTEMGRRSAAHIRRMKAR